MSDRNALIARVYSDKEFQEALLKDPKKTLDDNNFSYDQDLLNALNSVACSDDAKNTLSQAQEVFNRTQSSEGQST